jgi:hypothetical protein
MSFTIEDYKNLYDEEKPFADRLAGILIDEFNPSSVVDYGCANGLYLHPFHKNEVKIHGYEVSKEALEYPVVPRYYLSLMNETDVFIGERFFDLAICLEVMEHIPEQFAALAVYNLTRLSETIIFTAAQPGQGGNGHINCQIKEYWIDLFDKFHFKPDEKTTEVILDKVKSGYHMGWFVNNLIVFRRK